MPSILITGVSSGIGRACAELFSENGWTVIGTTRSGKGDEALSAAGITFESLDLSEKGSATELGVRVIREYGCPDVLLNNAGTLQFGPLEAIGPEDLEALYRVNVFGQLELIQSLLPSMRQRGSGVIANVTSLGGRMVFPFFAGYNSTKWALEGISEGLWHELQPFGIRVKAIEPGFVETNIWGKVLPESGEPVEGPEPYRPYMEEMREFESSITERTPPEESAEQIWRAITDESDRLRYPVAAYAKPLVAARRMLGDRVTMRFFHGKWMDGDSSAHHEG
jgi:NAD(P)-dependent dehydrogenase (short-subunit alcohol dehydrogenase family)